MALNNPAFNNPAFQDPKAGQQFGVPGAPAGTMTTPVGPPVQATTTQLQGVNAAAQAGLEGAFAAPPAGSLETGRMTVEDTVMKTAGLFGILLVTAVVGWIWTLGGLSPSEVINPSITPWLVGLLGGFALSMVVIFTSRKKVRPALIFAYAAFEGLFIGGISAFFEVLFPGIVMQATVGTMAVVGVTLALFASGKVRASKRATKIFMIAMFGYMAFALLNLVLMWTNILPANMMFGMHSAKIGSIPLGLILGVFIVLLAAYSLVLDFDRVQQGVRNGAPREFGWLGAFGIMVTVVWLYVEILRIIAIARSN